MDYQAPLSFQIKPLLKYEALLLLGYFGRAHLETSTPLWLRLLALTGMIAVAMSVLSAGLCKIRLDGDRIEKRTWFGKQVWRREDVARIQRGTVWPRSRDGFRLVHRYDRTYYFSIPRGIERDAAWNAWLADLPEEPRDPTLFEWLFKRSERSTVRN